MGSRSVLLLFAGVLTAAIALKLTYFCCIIAFAVLSQLYAEEVS